METNTLNDGTDDDNIIPCKKVCVSVDLDNISQNLVENIITKKVLDTLIVGPSAVSVPNLESVQQPKEVDNNLKEDIKAPASMWDPSPDSGHIGSPVCLDKLLLNPEQNNEIKICETVEQIKDLNVTVQLFDHSNDIASIQNSEATEPTTGSAARAEKSTVLNNEKRSRLPDAETSQVLNTKAEPENSLDAKKISVHGDITNSEKSDLSTALPKNNLSSEGCKNKTYDYILTRSRSRAANVLDLKEASTSSSAPQQIKIEPENRKTYNKQCLKPMRRLVQKKKTGQKKAKGQVMDLPKFRPWPSVPRGTYMGNSRSHQALTLMNTNFCKTKSIFLDNSLEQIDEKWQARLLEKGQHSGLEWKMFQYAGESQLSVIEKNKIERIQQKLYHSQTTGAKILNLSEDIYRQLASEGSNESVVEVTVHHRNNEATPATAWIIQELPQPDADVTEQPSEEKKE